MTPKEKMKEYVLKLIGFKVDEMQRLVKNNEGERKKKWEQELDVLLSHRTEFLKLFEKESPQWIKKQDKLPAITEGFFNCLICGNDKQVMQSRFNCKTQRFQNMNFQDIHDTVISWTPLPESPIQ